MEQSKPKLGLDSSTELHQIMLLSYKEMSKATGPTSLAPNNPYPAAYSTM